MVENFAGISRLQQGAHGIRMHQVRSITPYGKGLGDPVEATIWPVDDDERSMFVSHNWPVGGPEATILDGGIIATTCLCSKLRR